MHIAKKESDTRVGVYKSETGSRVRSFSMSDRIVRVNIEGDEISIACQRNDGSEKVYVYRISTGSHIRSF